MKSTNIIAKDTLACKSNNTAAENNLATICLAGDSGDGIQVIGKEIANTAIKAGKHVYTMPDFPAEIRPPAGTIRGVSSFQLCLANEKVIAVGDNIDTLVAFNPAALQVTLPSLKTGGILLVDDNKFSEQELKKAQYDSNPLTKDLLQNYQLLALPITELTKQAVESGSRSEPAVDPFSSSESVAGTLSHTVAERLAYAKIIKCRNMFILGIIYCLYKLPIQYTLDWLASKFTTENLIAANQAACKAGYDYAMEAKLFSEQCHFAAQQVVPTTTKQCMVNNKEHTTTNNLRYITGNQAIAMACLTVASQVPKGLFAAGYPLTPSSEILQELTKYPDLSVTTFQAEDEISAIAACVGAAFGGAIGVTCTSGPGFDLKQEGIGLAVMAELPVVIINVQRAGPSTGMPTKSEQGDLLAAMYGRHGEAPVVVLAANAPSDCFTITMEAAQIAVKYMTPVVILSDAILARAAESWQIPNLREIGKLVINYCQATEAFQPYKRDPNTFARAWAIPGTVNLTHRIGGLEKKDLTGEVSYEPENHEHMVRLRASKINAIANDLPVTTIFGDLEAQLLIISWGSTFGVIKTAIASLQEEGSKVAYIHLRYINPLPNDVAQLIKKFAKVVVIEANLGQLTQILRAKYLLNIQLIANITGKQFLIKELKTAILAHIK